MIIIYFFYGLFFAGLGLSAYLQMRQGGDLPLRKQLPWLAAFGATYGAVGWIDMFLLSGISTELHDLLTILRIVLQPISGLLLLIFGWGVLTRLTPLPSWAIFIPGVLIVPIAFAITYAMTTFITPSPIEIPIDIWSRYLLYLPGSIMAGVGFLRQWNVQMKLGYPDVSRLMLGAGLAFLFEAVMVGLIVPAAPYGPASYYNYDRVLHDAFLGESQVAQEPVGLIDWLDYERVLEVTGIPIQFWRLISAIAVTFFVMRGLDVFESIRKHELLALQLERDRAQRSAFDAQIAARQSAENWTDLMVQINRQIVDLKDVDDILLYIVENARKLLNSDYAAISLLNQVGNHLDLKYHACQHNAEILTSPEELKNLLLEETVGSLTAYRSGEQEDPARLEGMGCPDGGRAKNVAIVPLALDEHPIGGLWIARSRDEPCSETDLIWLECMADQAEIAIQHGLMTAQLQSLSVVEERSRIAREMHDGLAQILGYLNVQVQTLESHLKRGKLENLSKELHHLRDAVQLAHADVRENILSLRTTLGNEAGLIPAMQQYIDEFGIQTGIEVELTNHVGEQLNLSSIAEVQLVCILQEALTNVRKHAQASHVDVILDKVIENHHDYILVQVVDDGIGFNTQGSKRSFGLHTMRERAESVQGDLNLKTALGAGTTVKLIIPCWQAERERKAPISSPHFEDIKDTQMIEGGD